MCLYCFLVLSNAISLLSDPSPIIQKINLSFTTWVFVSRRTHTTKYWSCSPTKTRFALGLSSKGNIFAESSNSFVGSSFEISFAGCGLAIRLFVLRIDTLLQSYACILTNYVTTISDYYWGLGMDILASGVQWKNLHRSYLPPDGDRH